MKCPECGERKAVEVDMHSGGFTAEESPIKECGACGLIWRIKTTAGSREIDVIKPGKSSKSSS